jgi:hypothetical protein
MDLPDKIVAQTNWCKQNVYFDPHISAFVIAGWTYTWPNKTKEQRKEMEVRRFRFKKDSEQTVTLARMMAISFLDGIRHKEANP